MLLSHHSKHRIIFLQKLNYRFHPSRIESQTKDSFETLVMMRFLRLTYLLTFFISSRPIAILTIFEALELNSLSVPLRRNSDSPRFQPGKVIRCM